MYISKLVALLSAIILTSLLSNAASAATVSMVASGNNSFYVQGSGMNEAAGIELSIKYDQTLTSPKIEQGNVGGMFVSNPIISLNTIKIAIVSANRFPENAQIAKISFAPNSASSPLPIITAYNFIDSKGAPLTKTTSNLTAESPAIINEITQPTATPDSTPVATSPTTTTTVVTSTSNQNPTYIGGVAFPVETSVKSDAQPIAQTTPDPTIPEYTPESTSTTVLEQTKPEEKQTDVSKTDVTVQHTIYKGVLDRFKQFGGVKKLTGMTELFNKKVALSIQQVPEVLLSDGKNKATLTIDLSDRIIGASTNFATNGGKLISFKQNPQIKGRWVVEIIPENSRLDVVLTIITEGEELDYPLTVAPIIKTTLPIDEVGWNRFIKEIGTKKVPLHDFNNDGIRNYIDEYIFVANFLANKSIKKAETFKKTDKKR